MGLERKSEEQIHVVDHYIDPVASVQMVPSDHVVRALADTVQLASVDLATAAALPACTAAGAGVGKTLTADAVGVLTVDSVATVLNDRILVKDQVAGKDNGIYAVTTEGTTGVAFVLTRATDADVVAELPFGLLVPITTGTVGADQVGTLTTAGTIVVDTTVLTFTLSAGDFTITLPFVASGKGQIYTISAKIVTAVNVVTITDKGDSESWTDLVLDTANDCAVLYSDGCRWWTIGGAIA